MGECQGSEKADWQGSAETRSWSARFQRVPERSLTEVERVAGGALIAVTVVGAGHLTLRVDAHFTFKAIGAREALDLNTGAGHAREALWTIAAVFTVGSCL